MSRKRIPLKIKIDEKGCHIPISHKAKNRQGYFLIMRGGKCQHLHRWLYKQKFGEITRNIDVCHSCDNTSCINLEHLHLGTRKENLAEARERNRTKWGERNPSAKIDSFTALSIFIDDSLPIKYWSVLYGMDYDYIFKIRSGKRWEGLILRGEGI